MKKKFINILKSIRKKISKYLTTNRLFITFVIFALIETVLIRQFTYKDLSEVPGYKPFICDLALLIIIGSFGYFIKPKKQFNYYFIWLIVVTAICVINSIYYVFYTNFVSVSLLAGLGLVGEVGDSLVDKFRFVDFMYIIFPIIYYFIHSKLKKGSYYHFVAKIEDSKKMFTSTILVGVICLAFTLVNITGTDASRLIKVWDRELVVQRFGILFYQGDDIVTSLIPKVNSLFGYDEAAMEFKTFFGKELTYTHESNKYTGILEGMNVIFIHMESIQNWLVDTEINGVEMTPTLNKLTKEGMYFSNFYPQVSTGTSSDTEFTLNTSLMPTSIGIAFTNYYDRDYITIPKLLKEKGYYTFSAHGNGSSMWNRDRMHPSLGYDEMIFKKEFDIGGDNNDKTWVGLGISDEEFFRQLQPKLEKIETEHTNYMGTLIQLSNHSPYADLKPNKHPERYDDFGRLDLTNTYTVTDPETGETETITDDYLDGLELGDYLRSAHYADMALGTFFEYVENSPYYENTVFVLYGDHDARIDKKDYAYYYNYNTETGEVYEEGDPNYVNYDKFANEINKKTPLVIWTKNKTVAKKLKRENTNVIGMYDIVPTLGNMMNFENKFALGHDIYDIKDENVVIFPNGNFITNKVYFNNASGQYVTINNEQSNKVGNISSSPVIDEDYISNLKEYTEERLNVSNDMIVHDLIAKEGDNIVIQDTTKESGE